MESAVMTINLAAIGLYGLIVAACLAAAIAAQRSGRPAVRMWHWLGCAALFIGLAAARWLGLEEAVRDTLRTWLEQSGSYRDRTPLQVALFSFAVVATTLAGVAVAWRGIAAPLGRGHRLVWLSRLAVAGFAGLFALRLVSLHFTDKLLYSGPVRLNWLLDAGLSLTIGGCALLYVAYCRGNALPPRE